MCVRAYLCNTQDEPKKNCFFNISANYNTELCIINITVDNRMAWHKACFRANTVLFTMLVSCHQHIQMQRTHTVAHIDGVLARVCVRRYSHSTEYIHSPHAEIVTLRVCVCMRARHIRLRLCPFSAPSPLTTLLLARRTIFHYISTHINPSVVHEVPNRSEMYLGGESSYCVRVPIRHFASL